MTWGAHGLVSRRSGGNSAFYTFDQRGATVQRLDSTQTVLSSNAFDAFGVPAIAPADPYDGLGAQYGYYRDSETGLQLLTHRYYDPANGRFATRDPIRYAGGLGLYSYCNANPTSRLDQTGLRGEKLWYDRLADWVTGTTDYAKSVLNDRLPWGVAGWYGTQLDVASGVFKLPARIGHYGEGFGQYAGNPNDTDNQIAFWSDFGLTCEIALAGVTWASPKSTHYQNQLAAARLKYPGKAGTLEWHHIEPKYMGGDPKGVQVQIDAAYHQMITNEFRSRYGYGQGPTTPALRAQIARKVYAKFPIPKGAPRRGGQCKN